MGKFATLTAVAGAELLIIFGFLGLGAFGYAQRPDPASNVVPLAAVVLGSIAACVSFCGLVGAIYRSKFMVRFFEIKTETLDDQHLKLDYFSHAVGRDPCDMHVRQFYHVGIWLGKLLSLVSSNFIIFIEKRGVPFYNELAFRMQYNLHKNNLTDTLLPMSDGNGSNSSDPAISASYYDSNLYEPRSNFYDYTLDIVNYTYYYNDVAYTANYTTVIESKKPLDERNNGGPAYDQPIPIMGLHPFRFFSMIICIVSLILFLLYIESVLVAGRLLSNRKYKQMGNGDTVVEW